MEDNKIIIGKIINIESGKLERYPLSPIATFTLQNQQESYIIQCICNSESLLKTTKKTLKGLENERVIVIAKKHKNDFCYNLISRIRKI